jgi:hypothetical protein
VEADNFSALFQSTQEFSQTGTYRFTLRFNDGIRVKVNGVMIYEDFTPVTTPSSGDCSRPDAQCREVAVNHDVNAGPVELEVEYVEYTGVATLQVQWGFTGTTSVSLLNNGNFEKQLDSWSVKNKSGDRVKCNSDTKTYAFQGECAFRFKGTSGENAKLQQKSDGDFSVLGHMFLQGHVNAEGTVNSSIKLIISYTDSQLPKDKFVIDILSETGGYVPLSPDLSDLLLQPKDSAFEFKLVISNKSDDGRILFDRLSLEANLSRSILRIQPLP